MSGTYRPIYEDENVGLAWDQTSQWATAAGSSISATNFQSIAGAATWTIQIPGGVSALVGTLTVQVNNANPVMRADSSGIPWSVNPLLHQPSMTQKQRVSINPSFTACWSSVGVVGGAISLTAFSIPSRYVRLLGAGVTALSTGVALVWSDGMSRGN